MLICSTMPIRSHVLEALLMLPILIWGSPVIHCHLIPTSSTTCEFLWSIPLGSTLLIKFKAVLSWVCTWKSIRNMHLQVFANAVGFQILWFISCCSSWAWFSHFSQTNLPCFAIASCVGLLLCWMVLLHFFIVCLKFKIKGTGTRTTNSGVNRQLTCQLMTVTPTKV